jgi:hypothetical protein
VAGRSHNKRALSPQKKPQAGNTLGGLEFVASNLGFWSGGGVSGDGCPPDRPNSTISNNAPSKFNQSCSAACGAIRQHGPQKLSQARLNLRGRGRDAADRPLRLPPIEVTRCCRMVKAQ